jgi:hypothetical protein
MIIVAISRFFDGTFHCSKNKCKYKNIKITQPDCLTPGQCLINPNPSFDIQTKTASGRLQDPGFCLVGFSFNKKGNSNCLYLKDVFRNHPWYGQDAKTAFNTAHSS